MNRNVALGLDEPGPRLVRRFRLDPLVYLLVIVLVTFSVAVPNFMSPLNLQGLMLSVSLIGIVAVTTMFVLAMGEVDLSVGSIVALAAVVGALGLQLTGSVWFGVLAGVLSGSAVGAVNGILIAKFKVNSLIATLAMMEIVRGGAYIASKGDAVIIVEERFFDIGNGQLLGIGYPVWLMLLFFAVFGFILNNTVYGRNVLAIGGNREAARLAGLAVDRIRISTFILQGSAAGLAGVLLASRLSIGDPKTSQGLELAVISACVLGGVSLSGGVATVVGVFVGVLLMGSVQNALSLLNVPTFYQYVVRGGILLAAILFDRSRAKHST